MKRLAIGLGLLGIASASAGGCDDTRPVVGLAPDGQAGEMAHGGEPGAGGSGSAHAGMNSAGSLNRGGGGDTHTAGTGVGGHSEGGQAPEAAGAGGAAE